MLAGVSVEYYSRLERGDAAGVHREHPRRHCRRTPARPGRTPTPARPGSDFRHQPRSPPTDSGRDGTSHGPARPGRHHRCPGHRSRRPAQPPGQQRAGQSPVRTLLRSRRGAPQQRSLHLPRPPRARVLPRLGPGRRRHRRHPARRSRPRPHDRNLSDLIGELSTRSDEFRTRWAAHDVRIHATGTKRLRHPVVGDLDLSYESFPAPDPDHRLLIYVAEPGTPSHDALNLLASYAATQQHADPTGPRDAHPHHSIDRAD